MRERQSVNQSTFTELIDCCHRKIARSLLNGELVSTINEIRVTKDIYLK